MDPSKVAELIDVKMSQSQNNLLSELDNLISSRLNNFQQSFGETQKILNDAQVAKIREMHSDDYKFQRRGNEEQHKVNVKIHRKLVEANHYLEGSQDRPSAVSDAKEKIVEGIDIIEKRQKLIKMADKSPLGWKLVDEYEQNTLADDSDDEKRMFKAEARAERKAKKSKKPERRRYFPYSGYRASPWKSHPGSQKEQGPSTSSYTSYTPFGRTTPEERKKPGICFSCGKPGHWKVDCPSIRGSRSDQISESKFFVEHNKIVSESSSQKEIEGISEIVQVKNTKLYEEAEGQDTELVDSREENVSPVGKLKENASAWAEFGASKEILDVIQNGYKLPLHTLPDDRELTNNISARNHSNFVQEEIGNLLKRGCVSEVQFKPSVVNPLTVSENKGKLRLVLDCRHVNPHLYKNKFKYEDASVARDIFEQGDNVFTFDLKSAYHHVEIFEEHRKYLGFCWEFHGQKRYFVFNVLPFGISTAGYIFTKLTRVPVTYWRSQGKKVVMFLDDGIAGCSDMKVANEMSRQIKADLNKLGFVLAETKCDWFPQNKATWLGMYWDFHEGDVYITETRMQKCKKSIEDVLTKIQKGKYIIPVRTLASVAGQIISMQPAIGTIVQLKSKEIFKCINNRASWNAPVLVTGEAVTELLFWYKHLDRLNGVSISRVKSCNCCLFTDASGTGFGAYVSEIPDLEVVGSWTDSEMKYSSSWREIEALNRALKSVGPCLEGQDIRCYTDNKNVTSIVQRGSKNVQLQEIAIEIHDTCDLYGLGIDMVWIPREMNVMADSLSRISDSDDWSISHDVFQYLNQIWGPHVVDRFSCDYNAKCSRFNSRWGCPSTGVDAFKQSWANEINWWVPPPRLAARAIGKIVKERAEGTLIVPVWESAPF
ncbi:uncharacterized protein LOC121406809 [Lytechinus variegatus]|uniref:uncharacterized protein LOC121406809 n=1 Tax=Lytechinus variegatus TaxID=7654 RepID=UPI001BB1E7D3|nr:uncharacterized protein LOC121406809 [Lytechinus variegatus]